MVRASGGKRCGLGLLAAVLSFSATDQIICALGPGASSYVSSSDQRPSPDAMQLVGRLNAAVKTICAANCPEVMVLRNTTAANAMLLLKGDQARFVYAPQFFASAHDAYGDAGIMALVAHEFGHGLDDALGAAWIQKNWSPELRADAWAGCALARTGFSAGDTDAALGALRKYPAPSHPAWNLRLPVIRAGYVGCGGDGARLRSGDAPSRK